MKKRFIFIFMITLVLSFLLPPANLKAEAKEITTLSGKFITKKGQRYFRLSSGKYVKSKWLNYKNKKYYFDKKGIMATGWKKISGSWYCFKSNGVLNTSIKNSQFILVRSSGTTAKVYMLKQGANGKWKQTLSTSGFIGRSGASIYKQEGDGRTPKGTYSFGRAFGVLKNPGTNLSYTKLNSSHYWVDDSSSKYYNQFVSTKEVTKDWRSAEHLFSYKTAYAYVIAVNYNQDCSPGKGSAIFLHCSTGRPTAGCIAVSKKSMKKILKTLNEDAQICIY